MAHFFFEATPDYAALGLLVGFLPLGPNRWEDISSFNVLFSLERLWTWLCNSDT